MRGFEDVHYESADGLRLYARDYRHVDSRTSLLCLHGILGNSRNFERIADRLSPRYRLIVPDARGRGRSEYQGGSTALLQAQDILDLGRLVSLLDLKRVVILGTSMGGLTGMILSAILSGHYLGKEIEGIRRALPPLSSGLVRGLILNDVGPELGPRAMPTAEDLARESAPVSSWEEVIARLRQGGAQSFPDYTDEDWRRLATELYVENEHGIPVRFCHADLRPAQTDDAPVSPPPPMWPLFDALETVPVLVLRGELSGTLTAQCVEEMRKRRRDLHSVEVPRCGHCPTLLEPESTAAIDDFLASIPQ